MNGINGRGVGIGEFDLCEMEEDLANLIISNNNLSNGGGGDGSPLDSASSNSTTNTLPAHDIINMETDLAATLKQQTSTIKQNGTSKTMSIVHSYNYTGKHTRKKTLTKFSVPHTNC